MPLTVLTVGRYVASLVPWLVKGNLTAKDLKSSTTDLFEKILSIAMNAVETISETMTTEEAKSLRRRGLMRLMMDTQVHMPIYCHLNAIGRKIACQ